MNPRKATLLVGSLICLVILVGGPSVRAEGIMVEFSANPPQGVPFELYGDITGHINAISPAQVEVLEVDEHGTLIGTCTAQVNSWSQDSSSPQDSHRQGSGAAFWVPHVNRPPPRRFLIRSNDTHNEPTEPQATGGGENVQVHHGYL